MGILARAFFSLGTQLSSLIIFLLSLLIKAYHAIISPLLGPRCRYHPSCSQYALEALKVHGLATGLWLSIKRVASCSGLSPGGIDNVPPKETREI